MDEVNEEDITLPELPAWLKPLVPEVADELLLDYQDGKYTIDGESFDGFAEAYDWANGEGLNFKFSKDVPETEGDPDGFISVPSTKMTSRMFFTLTDQRRLELIQYAYHSFLSAAEAWEKDPTNFLKAYSFIDQHPAFWTRSERDAEGPTWHWDESGYAQKVWSAPLDSERVEQGYMWALEAGAHVEPAYTSHYHDLRLDVYAETIEGAYIKLAELVHKFFHLDGSERENVEYEKSELELILESRIADMENDGPLE